MPIYEYLCSNCQFRLEKIQKFSDTPLVDCPSCDSPALKKANFCGCFSIERGWLVRNGLQNWGEEKRFSLRRFVERFR